MRHSRISASLLATALAVSTAAWGQGRNQGGRGAAAPQTGTPANAAGRGGRAGFYDYDPSASSGQAFGDSQPVETHQKITVNGQPVAYLTRAGYLPLRNATTGHAEAHIFYTSYAREGGNEATTRPILFFFGGGPGVAAAWQEFGGLGPKRMRSAGEGEGQAGWVENPGTPLSLADLVFVNPVGTGYSRPDQPASGPNFWNTTADVASLGEFVRSYLVRFNRRGSPLFLAGEDFGTGRVGGLAAYLEEHQVPVHGVVLLSMTMSADALAGDTQYITLLPSLIVSAWHHKKLAPELSSMSLEQIAGQARQFAAREYLHALYKGDRMTAEERTKVTGNLARLTGLSKAFVTNNNLRISLDRFNAELLREQRKSMSGSDARVTGFQPPVVGGGRGFAALPPAPPIDFSLSALAGPFLTAYEAYLRRELTFTGNSDGIYYLSSGGVHGYTASGGDDASLAAAFARNPNLRLFVGVDYFDLNTPFYATEYTVAHLNVSPEVRARNITVSHYEAGQMAYADSKALVKLQRDLGTFIGEGPRK